MLRRSSVLLHSWVFIRPGPRERMALFIFTLAYVTSGSCRLLLTCGIHYRKAHYSSKDCKNASPPSKVSSNRLRSPKCCSCTNIKSRMAADCFAAAGRLQYTSFQTNSVDLNDALLLSFHDWDGRWAAIFRHRWKSFVWTPAAKDARGCKRRWR